MDRMNICGRSIVAVYGSSDQPPGDPPGVGCVVCKHSSPHPAERKCEEYCGAQMESAESERGCDNFKCVEYREDKHG
jgi:hypothetical protein